MDHDRNIPSRSGGPSLADDEVLGVGERDAVTVCLGCVLHGIVGGVVLVIILAPEEFQLAQLGEVLELEVGLTLLEIPLIGPEVRCGSSDRCRDRTEGSNQVGEGDHGDGDAQLSIDEAGLGDRA